MRPGGSPPLWPLGAARVHSGGGGLIRPGVHLPGGVEGAAHGVVGRGGVALSGGHGGVAEEALDGEQVAVGELGGPAGAGWRA